MKRFSIKNISALAVCALLLLGVVAGADTEYQQAVGLIHMDSQVSGGDHSLAMLAAVAKNAGADVAIVTDHDTQKATYGIWPLRKLLRVSHSRASVRKYGVERYLDEIELIDRDLDEFDFLPGIETVPYYAWGHSSIQNKLVLKDLHRHLLVMGLDNPEHIRHLPSIEEGYPEDYTMKSLLRLLWILPLIIAFILYKPPDSHTYYPNIIARLFSHQINLVALPLMITAVVFLVDGYPYKEPYVDQYRTDITFEPYQYLIDYVNACGGLIFWAHPEAAYTERISTEQGNPFISTALSMVLQDGLDIMTEPYYNLLNATQDYTGFAIFFEGTQHVGNPGGLWDSLLLQFCSGTRRKPVWAISEIDMESGTDPKEASQSQSILLVKNKTKADYLNALKNGRVYCYTKDLAKTIKIRECSIASGGRRAISGEVVPWNGDAVFTLDLGISRSNMKLEAVIICDGRIIKRVNIGSDTRIEVPLSAPVNEMGYIRVMMYSHTTPVVATNPIFYLNRAELSVRAEAGA